MNLLNILCFFGVEMLPVGVVLSYTTYQLLLLINKYYTIHHRLYFVLAALVPSLLIMLFNSIKMLLFHEEDFIPLGIRNHINGDKLTANRRKELYRRPSRKYVSKDHNGLQLGRYKGRVVRVPVNNKKGTQIYHSIVIGGSGSGKSAGVFIPTIVSNYSSNNSFTIFAVDIKGELSEKVKHTNNVRVIDPTDRSTYGYDVYANVTQFDSDDYILEEVIKPMSRTLIVESNEKNAFFTDNARVIFQGMALFYYRKQVWTDQLGRIRSGYVSGMQSIGTRSVIEHIQWIKSKENEEILRQHPMIYDLLNRFNSDDSEAMQGIELSLQQSLSIFLNSDIEWFLNDNPKKVSPNDLNNHVSIFFRIPERKLENYRSIFRLIINQVLIEMEKRPEYSDPILLMIDEFPRLGKIDRIIPALSTLRSKGVSICMALQDMNQLYSIYGDHNAKTILGLCEITCVLSCRDDTTANLLQKWCGKYVEDRYTHNQNTLSKIQDNRESVTTEEKNILEMSDLMKLRNKGEALVFFEGEHSILKKNFYFKDKYLKNLVEENMRYNKRYRTITTQKHTKLCVFFDEVTLTQEEIQEVYNDNE